METDPEMVKRLAAVPSIKALRERLDKMSPAARLVAGRLTLAAVRNARAARAMHGAIAKAKQP